MTPVANAVYLRWLWCHCGILRWLGSRCKVMRRMRWMQSALVLLVIKGERIQVVMGFEFGRSLGRVSSP